MYRLIFRLVLQYNRYYSNQTYSEHFFFVLFLIHVYSNFTRLGRFFWSDRLGMHTPFLDLKGFQLSKALSGLLRTPLLFLVSRPFAAM